MSWSAQLLEAKRKPQSTIYAASPIAHCCAQNAGPSLSIEHSLMLLRSSTKYAKCAKISNRTEQMPGLAFCCMRLPKLMIATCCRALEVTGNTKRCLNLSSYNYLGFAAADEYCTPRVQQVLRQYGGSMCSSRLAAGNATTSRLLMYAAACSITTVRLITQQRY